MSRQKYEYKQLKVTELLLNPQNPRFNPVKHQTETILAMIEDQQSKLIALAKHILEYGLNPTDIVLVEPYEKQWVVLEGNRRITALKLMNAPELISDDYPKIKREFQKLNAILDNALIENIPCVFIGDKVLANEWIRLKHTGENAGAGTVNWDGQQSSRFNSQASGTTDARIMFLDELKTLKAIPQEYKDRFIDIKKTNFDRLMSDPDIRALLGISSDSGSFTLIDGVNPYFLAVLYDLAFDNLSVGKIYYKEDRRKYIEEIKARVNQPETSNNLFDTNGNNGVNNNEGSSGTDGGQTPPQGNGNGKASGTNKGEADGTAPTSGAPPTGRSRGYPVNRKTLVPAQHRLTISHPRIVRIFNELKSLDIDTYPNAGAVLFRVFIELSADCYIAKHTLAAVNVDSRLGKKLEAIIIDLESKSIMTAHELRAAKQMSSSQTQNYSVKTFHSYVHNKDVTPSATDLRSAWEDLWTFTENIWR
jgi:hypothetical protein